MLSAQDGRAFLPVPSTDLPLVSLPCSSCMFLLSTKTKTSPFLLEDEDDKALLSLYIILVRHPRLVVQDSDHEVTQPVSQEFEKRSCSPLMVDRTASWRPYPPESSFLTAQGGPEPDASELSSAQLTELHQARQVQAPLMAVGGII